MLVLLAIFPSALNIPQSTPSETLEYAPVPPEDQNQPPPASGNFSSLGLGSSRGPGGAGEPGGGGAELDAGGEVGGRQVKAPSTKRCVGSPPRQTEDPLSPPCVGFFEGDNGGATYQGVTAEEVRILVLVSSAQNSNGGWKGAGESAQAGKYYDLAEPARDDDHSFTRYLRSWQRYFNERYQTYGRFVHFWAYYVTAAASPEQRRSEAIDNYNRLKPFGVVWPYGVAHAAVYNEVMATKGVLTFSAQFGTRAASFRKYPGILWGYLPTLDEHAKSYAAFICEKVAPHPIEFSGNSDIGQPRKYGLIYSEAPLEAFAKDFVALVKPLIAKCGVEFIAEATHPESGTAYDASQQAAGYGAAAMADFQEKGVTTILWMFGYETTFSRAAAAINYRPEWILTGDLLFVEGNFNGQDQEQSVWRHAAQFTLMTKMGPLGESAPCRDAYLEVDPEIPRTGFDFTFACTFYEELRQLFTGIQVAGARLSANSMDKGYHAIPAIRSKDPSVPACFYAPGDYTCVKDGTIFYFDPDYQDENSLNTPGCWRLLDGGQRYTAGTWSSGNVMAHRKASDPCNGWTGGRNFDD